MANIAAEPKEKPAEVRRFPTGGFDAKFEEFRKVKIFEVPGETNDVFLRLGDYPPVTAVRGKEIVLPTVLIKGCLDGSVVDTFKHVELPMPMPDGNIFQRIDMTVVRFPYQDLGPATEAEWKAQIGRK